MIRVVIYVAHYDTNNIIKIIGDNSIIIDILPEAQNNIFFYRQTLWSHSESGGLLLGYENATTKNLTVSATTIPQIEDIRSRCRLKLSSLHFNHTITIKKPYGYIGTWHTHPTAIPTPSTVDLKDWSECIKANKNKTEHLVFIIAGTEEFRVWVANCKTGIIKEGRVINE